MVQLMRSVDERFKVLARSTQKCIRRSPALKSATCCSLSHLLVMRVKTGRWVNLLMRRSPFHSKPLNRLFRIIFSLSARITAMTENMPILPSMLIISNGLFLRGLWWTCLSCGNHVFVCGVVVVCLCRLMENRCGKCFRAQLSQHGSKPPRRRHRQ